MVNHDAIVMLAVRGHARLQPHGASPRPQPDRSIGAGGSEKRARLRVLGRVDSPPVRDHNHRRPVGALVLLLAGGMAVSGVALTIGALEGEALFGRGKPAAWVFAAISVTVSALACGWAAASGFNRLTANHQAAADSGDLAGVRLAAPMATSDLPSDGGIC